MGDRTMSCRLVVKRGWVIMSLSTFMIAAVCGSAATSAQAQSAPCLTLSNVSADEVFNQALSTVRAVITGALRARSQGTWRPDGSFKGPFLARSGDSLRRIREELSQATVSKAVLLSAFDDIFNVRFPEGLRTVSRIKRSERRKFLAILDTLPNVSGSCAR